MAWLDKTKDPALRSSYQFGDVPYGAYWAEVPDDQVPPAPAMQPKPDRTEALIAKLKEKGVITDGDIPKPSATPVEAAASADSVDP